MEKGTKDFSDTIPIDSTGIDDKKDTKNVSIVKKEIKKKRDLTFNPEKNQFIEIDHREIYRLGFSKLTSEEKDAVLLTLLYKCDNSVLSNLNPTEALKAKEIENDFFKIKEDQKLKKIISISAIVIVIGILATIVLLSASSGILSDSGKINIVLNTMSSIAKTIWESAFAKLPNSYTD